MLNIIDESDYLLHFYVASFIISLDDRHISKVFSKLVTTEKFPK